MGFQSNFNNNFLLVREVHAVRVENRPVDAHAFHGRALRGVDAHGASGTTAHGAGQAHLAGQGILSRQRRRCRQHGRGAANVDGHLAAAFLIQAVQPGARQVRHVTLVTARVALQAREPTGDAPVLHQRHAGDDPGGSATERGLVENLHQPLTNSAEEPKA